MFVTHLCRREHVEKLFMDAVLLEAGKLSREEARNLVDQLKRCAYVYFNTDDIMHITTDRCSDECISVRVVLRPLTVVTFEVNKEFVWCYVTRLD